MCILSVSSVTSFVLLSMIGTVKGSLQKQLFEEIQTGELDNVKGLLRARARVDEVNKSGSTPLHCAVLFNQSDITRFLIKVGALINTQNRRDGNTPLHKAYHT